jgi:hypothetical protein
MDACPAEVQNAILSGRKYNLSGFSQAQASSRGCLLLAVLDRVPNTQNPGEDFVNYRNVLFARLWMADVAA